MGKKSPNPFPELTASPAIVHPPEFTLTAGTNLSHFHEPEPLLGREKALEAENKTHGVRRALSVAGNRGTQQQDPAEACI